MAIKVTVNSVPKNRISINTKQNDTVRAVGIAPISPETTVAGLKDVDMSDANTNETLVYDESTNKFVVKELPIVNGGTF